MNAHPSCLLVPPLLLVASSSLFAQTTDSLVKTGDPIAGVGAVTSIFTVQVLDSGRWFAHVDTDQPDPTQDTLLLNDTGIGLREGEPLTAPVPITLDEFDSIHVSAAGNLAACLRGMTVTPLETLAWNRKVIALRDSLLVDPRVGANTTWVTFDVCKTNAANEVFVIGDVANPAVAGPREATLCRFRLDDLGNVLASEVLLTRGQFVPALQTTVNDLPNTEHALAVNERGDWMTLIIGLGGVNAYVINGATVLAQEGAPSPVAGRTWRTAGGLTNFPRLSLNDAGEHLFSGTLEGSTGAYLIVKNGQKFAQSGDVYPSFSPSPLINGTAAPLILTDGGDVFWRADSALGSDDAFLRNFTPILQANRTVFNGDLVINLEPTDNAFSVSPKGRYFAGRVDLQLGGEAVLFVDFGLALPLRGCAGNPGSLAVTDGFPLPGGTVEFAMDGGQAAGALPTLTFSSREPTPFSECGLLLSFGELLISPAHRLGSLALPPWNGTQPSTLSVPIPPDPALVDRVFFVQGAFQTPTSPRFTLTNALRIEIGAP